MNFWLSLAHVIFVSAGVYLSKYSDLLQINPFEVGSYGDMIVFKVMRVRLELCCHLLSCLISSLSQTSSSSLCVPQGRVKHIHENMPKNAIEPSPKFDSHLSKSASRVTSLLSYRAFELTQVNTGSLSFACYQSGLVCWRHSQIRCVASLSCSNIFSSLRLMRSRPGPGTCVPTLWFPFSIRERKLQ